MARKKVEPLKKMTIKKALADCYEVWSWLAENPGKDKEESPLLQNKDYINECPCCEYVARKHNNTRAAVGFMDGDPENGCGDCPLIDLWPEGCCDNDSPYSDWCDGMDVIYDNSDANEIKVAKRHLKKAAKRIAKAARDLSEASGWHLG